MIKLEYLPLTKVLEKIIDNRGKTVPTVEQGFPLIATNCIKESSIYPTFENVRYVDDYTLKNWFRSHLAPNDILFTNKGTPGRVCLVPDPVSFCVAQDMIGFRADKEQINYKYLFAVLRTDWVKEKINNYHVGLVIPHFKKSDLDNILIPNLPLNEQENIGNLYFNLSDKIELNNQINQELEAMAKTLYDYWFVQFDFPNNEGKPYKSSGGKMVYNEELKREIPEGWEVGTFDDIGTVIGGSTPSKAIEKNFCINDGTPWITPRDLSSNTGNKFITRGEFDVTEMGIKSGSLKLMPKGTVLLSSRAPVGYLAISREPVTTNQGFKSFEPNKGYSTFFIYYTVKSMMPAIVNNAVGSTFKEISGATLKSIKIPLPPKGIIHLYDEKSESIFKRQDLLELENQHLAELRDWLLPMLMNGQVTVKSAEVEEEELGEALRVVAEGREGYKTV